MNKKSSYQEYTSQKKNAQEQQLRSRKEAVSEYLGLDPEDLVSYREFINNTVSALVPDGHKYWFIVTENAERTGWNVVPL
jgi:hypothetical protein